MVKLLKLLLGSVVTITASAFLYKSSPIFLSSSLPRDTLLQGTIRTGGRSRSYTMASPWTLTRSSDALDVNTLVNGVPRMAKDPDFASAVIDAWNKDKAEMLARGIRADASTETCLFEYKDPSDGATMHGHLIRRQRREIEDKVKVPGVLLFHTGAGPHDVFLQWKADSLASNKDVFPDGCVVLVVDILSDDSGWAWGEDRTKYNDARDKVLKAEASGQRPLLQSRIHAALSALRDIAPEVDALRICALGWCLGGHSVLELGRMQVPGMRAMITFHGVFDGVQTEAVEDVPKTRMAAADVLICHGDLDPFVDKETNLKYAIETLQHFGSNVRLLNLQGAKHGFTNPAQDYNPNRAFAYNEEAAITSWSDTLSLLKTSLS